MENKIICATCNQVLKNNETKKSHQCSIYINNRNQYLVDKKISNNFLNFFKREKK
jgi:hypothetical protein